LADADEHLQRAEADAQWTGEQVIARHHALALRAVLQALRGDGAAALATVTTRLGEHPRGYGDWGLWHALFLGCRIAAACNDAGTLREWLQRLRDLQPGLPDAVPARLAPGEAMLGTLAWL